MRRLAVLLVFACAFSVFSYTVSSPARAAVPAIFDPAPSWVVGISTKILVRVFEWIEWAEEDLRAQLDRRRGRGSGSEPSPIAALSGGSSTAPTPADASLARRARPGMIP